MKKFYTKVIHVAYCWAFSRLNINKAYPLGFWLALRDVLIFLGRRVDNPLLSRNNELCTGKDLQFVPDGALGKDEVIGAWTITKKVMLHILKALEENKPSTICECGSGVTTLMLAEYAKQEFKEGRAVNVITLEQDKNEINRIEAKLQQARLEHFVKIIYAPLGGGQYRLNSSQILTALQGEKIDFLLIDGPCGPSGCREHALYALAPFCSKNALWFLDDALRDGELRALQAWEKSPEFLIFGIYPYYKGLAAGSLN